MKQENFSLLIASADSKIRDLLRSALQEQDLELIFCGDGEEALQSARALHKEQLRCFILDMFLPKCDGFEVLRRMEENPALRHVPALMMIEPRKKQIRETANILLRADDYIEKPFTEIEIKQKVHSMTKYFREHAAPHPVTNLSGHPQLEKEIVTRLNVGENLSTLWIDINYFRPFNDHYGREQGDRVLKMAMRVFQDEVQRKKQNGFQPLVLAHVDGDDFILLSSKERVEKARENIRERFHKEIQQFYSTKEKKQGFFYENGRDQKKQIFPLMSLSAVIIPVNKENFSHYGELVSSANDLLHQAKLGSQEVK